jgi:hypothetical protein
MAREIDTETLRGAAAHDWLAEWLVSEDASVARVVANLPETPPDASRIVELNEAGELPGDDLATLEAGATRRAVA